MGSSQPPPVFTKSRITLILSVLLLVSGGLLVNSTATRFESYSIMSHWPATTGIITISEVVGERAFRPNVVYTYEVDGVVHLDSTDLNMPSFGGRNNRREAADTMAAMYPVGSAVTIHYNPENPSEAKMKVSPPWSVYGQLSFGITLILGGILAGLVSVRLKANRILHK
ncbi:DUF3592 domain-containing protein [bacterium]|nr:DUF3592 domain-containing protein [bacterium]